MRELYLCNHLPYEWVSPLKRPAMLWRWAWECGKCEETAFPTPKPGGVAFQRDEDTRGDRLQGRQQLLFERERGLSGIRVHLNHSVSRDTALRCVTWTWCGLQSQNMAQYGQCYKMSPCCGCSLVGSDPWGVKSWLSSIISSTEDTSGAQQGSMAVCRICGRTYWLESFWAIGSLSGIMFILLWSPHWRITLGRPCKDKAMH